MDKSDIDKVMVRLDALSDRCDRVISRRRELKLDTSVGNKRLNTPVLNNSADYSARPQNPTFAQPIATGELRGNEMRPDFDDRDERPKKRRSSGYRAPECDCEPDADIWAHFEREFDDMVARMR